MSIRRRTTPLRKVVQTLHNLKFKERPCDAAMWLYEVKNTGEGNTLSGNETANSEEQRSGNVVSSH